jgi:hypothetical protein
LAGALAKAREHEKKHEEDEATLSASKAAQEPAE